jgi:SNF2 family DNA or RNA helicase
MLMIHDESNTVSKKFGRISSPISRVLISEKSFKGKIVFDVDIGCCAEHDEVHKKSVQASRSLLAPRNMLVKDDYLLHPVSSFVGVQLHFNTLFVPPQDNPAQRIENSKQKNQLQKELYFDIGSDVHVNNNDLTRQGVLFGHSANDKIEDGCSLIVDSFSVSATPESLSITEYPALMNEVPISIGGFVLPSVIWKRLYAHQKSGVAWLAHRFDCRAGAMLGDEMGLGKTIQVRFPLLCFRTK